MAKKDITTKEETTVVDKEKLEKEIKKEVKENLINDLEKQVDSLIQIKLDKYEKKINKQKQRALLKKNIIIIILLGIVLFEGKILYDNGILNNSNYKNDVGVSDVIDKDNISNDQQVVEDKKDMEWYIEKYSYLLDNVKTNLTGNDLTYLYKEDYKVEHIDNKVRLNMAYQLLEKDDISNKDGFLTVDSSNLKDKYKSIFGNSLEFKNEDFVDNCIHFIYNEPMDKYLAVNLECAPYERNIKEEIISVSEKQDKIIIETILGIYDNKNNTISNLDNSFNKKYKDNLTEYAEKLDKFVYEFVKDADKYYFSKITKEK